MKHGRNAALAAGLLYGLTMGSAAAAPLNIADRPLFLPGAVAPLNMLVMGRDHRMYYEAYNDASDLDGDGDIDTGYKPDDIDYYGYFDSTRCYEYDSGVFVVKSTATNKKCGGSNEWSGDWLNYMTMSRIDAMRKVLYGGLRSTDTPTDTVLQRAFIPQDAHSWGKEYTSIAVDGYDIREYTPLDLPSGSGTRRHLFANTTPSGGTVQSGNTNPAINGVPLPLFRLVESIENTRIWNWVSKERPVADTSLDGGGSVSPKDYVVRVQVCAATTFDPLTSSCRLYGSVYKPTGLLQDYGESETMLFGLLTGSYGKPHDGGVLRKAIASFKDEIDSATGQIKLLNPPGIINTIDRLRTTSFNGDTYSCGWIPDSSDAAGKCSMWGNPIAEMMFESVRYFAGKNGPTSAFHTGANNSEETGIDLKVATWDGTTNPFSQPALSCAKPFQTVISDTSPSYDSDKVPGSAFVGAFTSDVSGLDASSLGKTIWDREIGGSGSYFIGESNGSYDGAPTPKTVGSFGNIRGLAPEAPAKEGSFNAASVAYFGLTNDVNSQANPQNIQTFAVALASPLPKIEIPVGGDTITLVPFAKSVAWPGNSPGISSTQGQYQPTNQIVDFYVETLTATSGRFRVNFEDVEQGADHDMDAIATYEYNVVGSTVEIKVTSDYAAGGIIQHLGYVISGTTKDGTYLVVRDKDTAEANDVNYFLDSPNDSAALPLSSTLTFVPGGNDAAGLLKDPLWYAAKWGGFVDSNDNDLPDVQTEWDTDNDGDPDNYFLVTNALTLKAQLAKAFDEVLSRTASASAVATNTTRLDTSTLIYQAQFRSDDWTGKLLAYRLQSNGTLGALQWDAASLIPIPANRKVFTNNAAVPGAATGTGFLWANLSTAHQTALNKKPDGTADTLGPNRVLWMRGDPTQEKEGGGQLRNRSVVLGDIINSDPQFVGALNFGYDALPAGPAQASYTTFRRSKINTTTGVPLEPMIYVGANDGILHGFDATTGVEHFAYVPSTLIPELTQLTDPAYKHRYFVDGQIGVGDAYIDRAGTDQWATVLVGTTGAGGKTVFALDVTRPHTFAATDVMWEFTDDDLGYTIGQPVVARMRDGTWVAVFGNGYNSTNHHAVLYIVRLADGVLLKKIDTGVGDTTTPNGLATPSLLADSTRTIHTIYAGDLRGNLWKFDVSNASPANWDVAFKPSGVNTPLFIASDSSGNRQPITAPVEIGRHPDGGMMIYFGTGKFFERGDNDVATVTPQVQTFYGIWDKPTPSTITYSSRTDVLTQQSIEYEGQPNGSHFNIRVTTQKLVDYSTKRGWYLDLIPPSPATAQGERVVSLPILRNSRVIFPTLIPSPNPCEFGGTSWLMELDAVSGKRLEQPPLDITEDGEIDNGDKVTVQIDTNGDGVAETVTVAPSAIESRQGIIDTPAVVETGEGDEIKIASGTSGSIETVGEAGSGERSRGSWRQLR